MNDEILPALTAKEWASIPAEWEDDSGPLSGIFIGGLNGTLPTGDLHNPYKPRQLIALLNHAADHDDPSAITHADVDACVDAAASIRQLMERFEAELNSVPFFDPIARLSRQWQDLEMVANKLRALLPPR